MVIVQKKKEIGIIIKKCKISTKDFSPPIHPLLKKINLTWIY